MKGLLTALQKGALPVVPEEGKEGQEIDSHWNSPKKSETDLSTTPAFLLQKSADKLRQGIAAKFAKKDIGTTKLILTLGDLTKPSAIKQRIDKMKVELMMTLNERVDEQLALRKKDKEEDILIHNSKVGFDLKKTLEEMKLQAGQDVPAAIEIKEPFKFWNPDKFNIFEPNKNYKAFHDFEFEDDYCMVAYEISKADKKKCLNLIKQRQIQTTTRIRTNGDTILHIAAEYGAINVFEGFMSLGKPEQITIRNDAGETPFMIACREGRIDFIKHLHDFYEPTQIYPEAESLDRWTGFQYACSNGFLNTIEFLAIVMQMNINSQDRFKRTALHWAARFGNDKVVLLLLQLGAETKLVDGESQIAADLAKHYFHTSVQDIFQKHHLNPFHLTGQRSFMLKKSKS